MTDRPRLASSPTLWIACALLAWCGRLMLSGDPEPRRGDALAALVERVAGDDPAPALLGPRRR